MTDCFNDMTQLDTLAFHWKITPNLSNFYVNKLISQTDSIAAPNIEKVHAKSSEGLSYITDPLENISTYGIGYDDVAGLIAIPLIVALFAFSFPFIFNEVNRINDKYESKEIADLLRSSFVYKAYFQINIISIAVLFIYGLSSLILEEAMRETALHFGNWILLIVAGIYSYVIFLFVKTCLAFNKPAKVIDFIDKEFKKTEKRNKYRYEISLLLFKISDFYKNEETKDLKLKIIRWRNSYIVENNKILYIEHLKALGYYSLKSEDLSVFYSAVCGGVDRIMKLEKDIDSAHHYVFILLISIFKYYARITPSLDIENSLVHSLFRFYNKSTLVSSRDIAETIACTAILANGKCENALSQYIDHSKHGFSFVLQYTRSTYVSGHAGDYLTNRTECIDNWDLVCSFHYLAAAYWFAKGCYGIFDSMTSGYTGKEPLYPSKGWHILLRYIRCRNRINNKSKEQEFDCFESKRIVGEQVNLLKMVDRFTVAFLLFATDDTLMLIDISDEEIENLYEAKNGLKPYVYGIKNDKKLTQMYPHILSEDFERKYDYNLALLQWIKEGKLLASTDSGSDGKPLCNRFKKLIGFNTVEPVRYRSVFDEPIDYRIISEIKQSLYNLSNNYQELELHFNVCASDCENMVVVAPTCITLSRMFFFNETWNRKIYFMNNDIRDIIDCRLIYLTLQSFRGGNNKNVITSFVDFESCISKVVKDHPQDFVFIDCDTPIKNLMLGESRKKSLVQELNWLKLNDIRYRSLEGLPDYEFYKGCIIIVHKQYMPSISGIEKKPIIDISEIPLKNGRSYEMILRYDPQFKVAFSHDPEIVVVRLKQS